MSDHGSHPRSTGWPACGPTHRPTGNVRRRARLWIAMGLNVAITLPLQSCAEPHLTAPCAIIVDGSGSGDYFQADRSLEFAGKRFLAEQKCGHVVFAPINGVSEASVCREKPLPMEAEGRDPQQIAPLRRAEAVKRAKTLLGCARKELGGSDILGALRRVERERPDGEGTYAILVVSDMIQWDRSTILTQKTIGTAAARRKLISKLEPRIPDMTGSVLFPTDLARGSGTDPMLTINVSKFWHELLTTQTAGSPRLDEHYGQ